MDVNQIIVQGCASVGKSAITIRFVHDVFVSKYDPTIEDSYRKPFKVGKAQMVLEIVDTAGTDQFASMRDLYMKNGDAFLLVCAVDKRATLDNIKTIYKEIMEVKGNQPPMAIAVNKVDLPVERRVIAEAEVQQLSKQYKIPYFFTSAANNVNITEVFTCLGSQLQMETHPQEERKKKRCNLL